MKKIELGLDDKKGEIFFWSSCNIMLSRSQIAWLQRELERVVGPAYSRIMYESSHIHAHHVIADIIRDVVESSGPLGKERLAEEMVKQLPRWGYGHGELVDMDFSRPYFRVKVINSFNAMGYEKSESLYATSSGG